MKTIEKMFDLSRRVAVITGGAGLLGKQHAEVLSEAGAHVVIADIDEKSCKEVAEYITSLNGVEALGIQVDISNKDSVEKMVDQVVKKFGRIDILINNAVTKSPNFFAPFEDFPLEDWETVMSVNITGMFLCAQAVGKQMLKQGHGVIINISSTYGVVGPDQRIYGNSGINTPVVYSTSKSAVINFTRYLATYWAGKNIRVNTLTPGGVYDGQAPEFVKNYCNRTPLGRMAKKTDYKGAILFLASDASEYMTGANLIVDGGWTAW